MIAVPTFHIRIIIVASIYGREIGPLPTEAPAFSAPYHLAKMAEINLAKTMARELAPWGIRVNSVAPGSILFPGGSCGTAIAPSR